MDQVWVSAICCTSRSKGFVRRWMKKSFCLFKAKFPNVYEAKLKEGIFVGAQIKQIFENHIYGTKLNATDRRVLEHLKKTTETS